MKRNSLAAQILWIATWTGNFLLTALAFILAVTHKGPLEPLLFLTVAVCILAGNFLPLTYFLISYFWDKAVLEAENAQSGETLRDAMVQLHSLASRYDDLNDAASKAVLIARQVPERISEKVHALEERVAALDAENIEALGQQFGSLNEQIASALDRMDKLEKALAERDGAASSTLQSSLDAARESGSRAESSVTRLEKIASDLIGRLETLEPGNQGADLGPVQTGLAELREAFEIHAETQSDRLDDLLERLGAVETILEDRPEEMDTADAHVAAEAEEPTEASKPADTAVADADGDPDWSVDVPDAAELDDDFVEEDDLEELAALDEAPDVPTTEPKQPSPKKKEAASSKKSKPAEPDLFGDMNVQNQPADTTPDGQSILVVKAMIGIANKLYLRGDPPLLSWDKGTRMELSAIGEYRFTVPDLDEPLECQLLLNDEKEADIGTVTLQPGQVLHVAPKFL